MKSSMKVGERFSSEEILNGPRVVWTFAGFAVRCSKKTMYLYLFSPDGKGVLWAELAREFEKKLKSGVYKKL